jgi:hypothetical protein
MELIDKVTHALKDFDGFLKCESCGRRKGLKQEKIGSYMASGWPKCCGLTMTWITKDQLKEPIGEGEKTDD